MQYHRAKDESKYIADCHYPFIFLSKLLSSCDDINGFFAASISEVSNKGSHFLYERFLIYFLLLNSSNISEGPIILYYIDIIHENNLSHTENLISFVITIASQILTIHSLTLILNITVILSNGTSFMAFSFQSLKGITIPCHCCMAQIQCIAVKKTL